LPKPELSAETLRLGADMKLRALCKSLEPRRVWPEILEGDAGSALVEVARAFNARMVIIGPHGSGLGAVTGFGSTASTLVAHCPVPLVVLTSATPTTPFQLLAPV